MRDQTLVPISLSLYPQYQLKREYGTRVDCAYDEVKYDNLLLQPSLTLRFSVKRLTMSNK